MTEKEIRRLRGTVLIGMIKEQTSKIEALQVELNEVRKMLTSNEIALEEYGSLLEQANHVTQIFDEAQQTADALVRGFHDKTDGQYEFFEAQKKEQEERLAAKEEETDAHLFAQKAHTEALLLVQEEEMNDRLKMDEMQSEFRLNNLEAETNARLAKKEEETMERLAKQEEEVRDRCEKMIEDARTRSQKYWQDIQAQMDTYVSEHQTGGRRVPEKEEVQEAEEDESAIPFIIAK